MWSVDQHWTFGSAILNIVNHVLLSIAHSDKSRNLRTRITDQKSGYSVCEWVFEPWRYRARAEKGNARARRTMNLSRDIVVLM